MMSKLLNAGIEFMLEMIKCLFWTVFAIAKAQWQISELSFRQALISPAYFFPHFSLITHSRLIIPHTDSICWLHGREQEMQESFGVFQLRHDLLSKYMVELCCSQA